MAGHDRFKKVNLYSQTGKKAKKMPWSSPFQKLLSLSETFSVNNKNFTVKKPSSFIEIKCKNLTKVPGSKELSVLKAKYLQKIINCLTCRQKSLICRFRELHAILHHLKRNHHVLLISSDLVLFISQELNKTTKLKLPILLKASHTLLSRKDKNVKKLLFDYSYAFNEFLINPSKPCLEKYLLNDIAADTLIEVFEKFGLKDKVRKAPALPHPTAFCNPQEYSKDLYSKIIRCFPVRIIKPDVPVLHCDIFFSDIFARRMLNCDKAFSKLIILCDNYLYCCIQRDVFDPSQRESDVNILYSFLFNLIRNEVLATSYSHANYESKHFEQIVYSTFVLCNSGETEAVTCIPQIQGHLIPINSSLPTSDLDFEFFRDPWDVLFEIEIEVEIQMEYFGSLSVETDFDICNYMDACESYVSSQESLLVATSFEDLNPFKEVLTDEQTKTWAYQRKKRPRQKRPAEPILIDTIPTEIAAKSSKKRRVKY